MSFRIGRRVRIGKGLGVNIGKRGVSVSTRTPFGSVGTSGYSVRTGIKGVSYRKRYSNASGPCSASPKRIAKIVVWVLVFIGIMMPIMMELGS